MGILLKGMPTAEMLTEKAREQALALKKKGVTPTLAIIRIGEREDDLAYERGAIKRCAQAHVAVESFALAQQTTQATLITLIQKLNADKAIHGVLIMRPLPAHIEDSAVCRALIPEKDIDGITPGAMSGIYAGSQQVFAPCTAQACIEILKHNNISIAKKRAVVVGRSLIIGKPVAMLLMAENATVTVCHSKTESLPAVCREADILVVAAGKPKMLGADAVSKGQVVLDVGIHVDENGQLCGDVDTQAASAVVAAVTPVPGGIGAVTTSVLASHVVLAAQRIIKEELQNAN